MHTISNLADLLSVGPVSLGKAPTNSIVALTLTNGRLGATLRIDKPSHIDAGWADSFIGYLAKAGADTAVLVCYADAPAGDDSYFEDDMFFLARQIQSELPIRVKDMALITPEYWLDYGDPSAERRPALEVQFTAVLAQIISNGEDKKFCHTIPPVRDGIDEDFTSAVAARAPHSKQFGLNGDTGLYLLWNRLVTGTDTMTRQELIRLLAGFNDLGTRDGLAIRIFTDNMDHTEYGTVLLGNLTFPFDRARFRRGTELVHELLTWATGPERAHLLSIAGWLHWQEGHGSTAVEFFDAAMEHTPDHRLSDLLRTLVNRGTMSPVASVKSNWM